MLLLNADSILTYMSIILVKSKIKDTVYELLVWAILAVVVDWNDFDQTDRYGQYNLFYQRRSRSLSKNIKYVLQRTPVREFTFPCLVKTDCGPSTWRCCCKWLDSPCPGYTGLVQWLACPAPPIFPFPQSQCPILLEIFDPELYKYSWTPR